MSRRYCGRDFHADDMALIRRIIAEDPTRTRAELSRLTCRGLHCHKPVGHGHLPHRLRSKLQLRRNVLWDEQHQCSRIGQRIDPNRAQFRLTRITQLDFEKVMTHD